MEPDVQTCARKDPVRAGNALWFSRVHEISRPHLCWIRSVGGAGSNRRGHIDEQVEAVGARHAEQRSHAAREV